MTDSVHPDCEALLAHSGWVRALARHLTADAHTAEDVAQDALAVALVRPPPADRPLRGWLAGIVRNVVRRERRVAHSRAARERDAARADEDASSAQLLERLESHRAVVEAVAELAEPYRSAILMRYFDDLSPGEIAERTGTPLRTVHTRLYRALARLRADLDRAHGGDRRTWLLALIPFARGSGGTSGGALGALVMDAKVKIALAAVAVVAVCSTFAVWSSRSAGVEPAPKPAAPSALAAAPRAEPDAQPVAERAPALDERRAQGGAPATPAAEPAAKAELLAGRVIDVERAPVAGVLVRWTGAQGGAPREAVTDSGGAFALEDPRGAGLFDVASPGWSAILRPELAAERPVREIVLVVARSVALGGIVVDESGRAVASAKLTAALPFALRARFDAMLDHSSTVERSTTTGSDGRFELQDVPLLEGARLVASQAGFLDDERDVPARDELDLRIVLRAASSGPTRLVGQVVDALGAPVADAWVALGDASTRSGGRGEFALELEGAPASIVRAVKPGHLPAELARDDQSGWPDPLILRLGGEPLAITGRVLDAAGEPLARAEVWTDEETRFGYVEIEGGEMSMKAGASIEGVLRGDPWTRRVTTDAHGRFRLAGLLPRDYRVHALDGRSLLVATRTIAAGAGDVELRLPQEELLARVAGRVTDLAGAPVQGVRVLLDRPLAGVETRGPDGVRSAACVTDGEGRFAFERVSRAVGNVSVEGPELGLLGFQRELAPGDDVEHLELAVPMRVHVQIEAGPAPDFDSAALLDPQGEKLYLSTHHGKSSYAMQDIYLQEGRTEPFYVAELARTLVLYRASAEVRRVPVKLVRGELNTLRP